jgi:alpha-tubulin suppressor-like RCC1 family protein
MVGGLVFSSIRPGRENNIFAPSCGITTIGEGYCWGSNTSGQLGTATPLATCAPQNPCSSRPVPVANNLRFTLIVPAGNHACGITTDQKLYCWGANDAGQLGDGSITSSPVPIQVASGLQIPR